MKNLKFQSVFDIISPVMVGPSSSHTAGAVRIGKIVSAIFGDAPTEVEFQLFNSFAKTYRGHGTDVALVAGILGMETDDPDIPHALDIAHENGIKVYWKINKDSKAPHPNTTRITLKNATKTKDRKTNANDGGTLNWVMIVLIFKNVCQVFYYQSKTNKALLSEQQQLIDELLKEQESYGTTV